MMSFHFLDLRVEQPWQPISEVSHFPEPEFKAHLSDDALRFRD